VTILSLIALKDDNDRSIKLMKILKTFLQNDITVFNSFSINKPLIRKLNLEEHLKSKNPLEREAALDLSTFILRFFKQTDFTDFSTDASVVQQLRREIDFRI